MYENTGAKIKSFAKVLAVIEIAFCIFVGFVLFFLSGISAGVDPEWLSLIFFAGALVIGIGGSLFAWLKFLFLASYGELVEETTKSSAYLESIKNILRETKGENDNNYITKSPNTERLTHSEKTFCSYCGLETESLTSRLCPDCYTLLENKTIFECPICSRYNHKTNKCKCQFW